MSPNPQLVCPQCEQPTRIIDRFTLAGSPGPVEHVKVMCERGHWFTLSVERLSRIYALAAQQAA